MITIVNFVLLAVMLVLVLIQNRKQREAQAEAMLYIHEVQRKCLAAVDEVKETVAKLEAGITPDYEKAKKATESLNSFNIGLSNVLGYDPIEALRSERNKGMNG